MFIQYHYEFMCKMHGYLIYRKMLDDTELHFELWNELPNHDIIVTTFTDMGELLKYAYENRKEVLPNADN